MVLTEEQVGRVHRALDDALARLAPRIALPERNAEIIAMRRGGAMFGEIASKFGISRQRVHMIWQREVGQVPTRRRVRKVELQRSEAAAG